jgi:hypothetical protein
VYGVTPPDLESALKRTQMLVIVSAGVTTLEVDQEL